MSIVEQALSDFDTSCVSLSKIDKSNYYKILVDNAVAVFNVHNGDNAWLYTNYGLAASSSYNKNIKVKIDLCVPHPNAPTERGKQKVGFILSHSNPVHQSMLRTLVGDDRTSGKIGTLRTALSKYLAVRKDDPDIVDYVNNQFSDVDPQNLESAFYDHLVSHTCKPTKDGTKTIMSAYVWPDTKFYDLEKVRHIASTPDLWTDSMIVPQSHLAHTSFECLPLFKISNIEFTTKRSSPSYYINIAFDIVVAVVRPVQRVSPGKSLLSGQLANGNDKPTLPVPSTTDSTAAAPVPVIATMGIRHKQ